MYVSLYHFTSPLHPCLPFLVSLPRSAKSAHNDNHHHTYICIHMYVYAYTRRNERMRIHSTNCSRHSNSDGQTQQQSCSPSTSPSLCHEGELEAVKGLVELAGIFAAERETWTHGENQESMPESGGNPNTNSARKRSESAGRTSRRKQPAEADSASVGQSTVGRASGPKSGSKPAPAKAAAPAGACFVYVVMSVCSCFSVRMCTCACQGFWCVLVYVCLCMLFSFCMCAEGCLCAHVNFVCI